MKAIVFECPNELRVREVPEPTIGPDEVLIAPKVRGICHSDIELLEGRYIIPVRYPVIPGHEWVGEVVEVGSMVTSFRPGDRVVGECVVGCGKCSLCKSGNFTYCPYSDHIGFSSHGANAEYIRARPSYLHKIPDSLSWREGALFEPFSVGYYALYAIGGVDVADKVLVFGGGMIGLATLIAAKGVGARVLVVEPQPMRAELAHRLGAEAVLDPNSPRLLEEIRDRTDGWGADVVVEASGTEAALQTLWYTVRNNGRVALVGLNVGQRFPVEIGLIQARGLRVQGTVGSPYVWERGMAFLERVKPELGLLVTHEYTLDEAPRAFEQVRKPAEGVKVHLVSDL